MPIGKIETHSYTLDLTQSVENEYLCLMIAREYGLPVPDCEILTLESIKGLAVRRFDRQFSSDGQWIMRIPQEDFCQVLNISPALKYENQGGPGIFEIMQYLEGSIAPKRDRAIFMRAQILFWLLAATDGHAKNFSLFIRANGLFELAPLYDIISLYPVMGARGIHIRDAKLAMSLRGSKGKQYNIHTLFPRHFYHTATVIGFSQSEMKEIIHEFALKTPEVVAAIQTKLPKSFPEHIKTTIFNGLLERANRLQL